jgi:DNA-binding transcriptional MerR regulator
MIDPIKEINFDLNELEEIQVEFELGDLYIKNSGTDSSSEDFSQTKLPDAVIEASGELMGAMDSIPDKMAFKIGEAADFVGVKQYVLRYWETEFEMLKPKKSRNGQRVYCRRDVETAMMIKKLLYEDRFSIEGARSAMRQLRSSVKQEKSVKAIVQSQDSAVQKMHSFLSEIRRIRQIFA